MKSIGIVRKIDELGRIVLPIELRRSMNINEGDPLEIYVEGNNTIVLKKYLPACIFCGDSRGIQTYKGYNICPVCAKDIPTRVIEE